MDQILPTQERQESRRRQALKKVAALWIVAVLSVSFAGITGPMQLESRRWPTVAGVVIDRTLPSEGDHGYITIHIFGSPGVTYEYEVNGKTYRQRFKLNAREHSALISELRDLPSRSGKRFVVVSYSPEDPAKSTLYPGLRHSTAWAVFIAVIAGTIATPATLTYFKRRLRRTTHPAPFA